MKPTDIFTVDTRGMRAIALRRGLGALLLELVQNALDENITAATVEVWRISNGRYGVRVTDDAPDGFQNLAESYTLYAPSKKANDAEKRGQFNIGEKFVIAACDQAQIVSTTGGYRFDDLGRHKTRDKRATGTEFYGELRTNQAEADAALELLRRVIVPESVTLTVNGDVLDTRTPLASQSGVQLPTWLMDYEGIMRPTRRQTTVTLYTPLPNTKAMLYEMGLPVVETGDAFDINVGQRVLLNQDRDNVTPGYRSTIRAIALNIAVEAHKLDADMSGQVWAREAMESERTSDNAIRTVLDLRFGPRRVSYDMNDKEANKRAIEEGVRVVHSRDLTADEWANVRRVQPIQPAGKLFPSRYEYAEDGEPERVIEQDNWTDGMRRIALHARWAGEALLGVPISVSFINEPVRRADMSADFGGRHLRFNVGTLGYKWFDREVADPAVSAVLIHEFVHFYSEDHLSKKYHQALCDLGGRMVLLALHAPEYFRPQVLAHA